MPAEITPDIDEIHAVIALGNPGLEYSQTRHNIGFMILDSFIGKCKKRPELISKYSGIYFSKNFGSRKVHFLKPMTFMNLSGVSVSRLADSFGLKPENILVIHDDLDFELGFIKLKSGGGSAGHNGIESIIEALGSSNFYRMRAGIGKDPERETRDYVLENFKEEETEKLKRSIDLAVDAINLTITRGVRLAMNAVNSKKTTKQEQQIEEVRNRIHPG